MMEPTPPAPGAGETPEYKYWAFISYSHADAKWGDWLHEALETYRVPGRLVGKPSRNGAVPARVYPVFRDREELAGSSSLNDKILSALRSSRHLVAICSPRSAVSRWVNAEIAAYKAMGREDRVLAIIVEGEPNAAPDSGLLECFPKTLRFRVDGKGHVTSEEAEPIAADAREGKDGRKKAFLKLLAGLLDVGFDELYQREKVRQQRAKMRRWLAVGVLALAALGLYWEIADAGVNVPGGEMLRARQDRYGLSLLRPVYSQEKIRRAAQAHRHELLGLMEQKLLPDGWISATAKDDTPDADLWSHAQAMAGVFRTHRADAERQKFVRSLSAPFAELDRTPAGEKPHLRWLDRDDRKIDKAVPLLWAVMSQCAGLATPGLLSEEESNTFRRRLEAIEQMLEAYRQEDGGWNLFPAQKRPQDHHLYSTTLALQMLLDLHAARLGWLGSQERCAEMIRATAGWLGERFDPTGDPPGWRGIHEDIRETYDGLTLQIHGELLRAQAAGVGFQIPARILPEIPKLLASCLQRDLSFPTDGGEFEAKYTNVEGREILGHEAIKYLWYPWAIDAAVEWLRYARNTGVAKEEVVQVQRALGHMVVDLGEAAVAKARTDWTFLTSENLYGLSAVPAP